MARRNLGSRDGIPFERLMDKVAEGHDYEPAQPDPDRLTVVDPICRVCGAPKENHK
jgi:hypothetical protein